MNVKRSCYNDITQLTLTGALTELLSEISIPEKNELPRPALDQKGRRPEFAMRRRLKLSKKAMYSWAGHACERL